MNDVKIFNNEEFGQIRTVTKDGEPWFVGKDVAEILGYADPNKAIAMHVDADDKLNDKTASSLGQRGGWIINESGLYCLILSSKLPSAKRFKRWVTSEVLPSLRKNGGYIVDQENMTPEQIMAAGLKAAQKIIENKDKEIFADAVSASHSSILIGEMAKLLKQNGVETGQKRLFSWLRENGYLIKRKGTDYNMPTQKAMELGLFEIKEGSYVDANGCNITTKTPKVTGKGQQYFVNKFLGDPITMGC